MRAGRPCVALLPGSRAKHPSNHLTLPNELLGRVSFINRWSTLSRNPAFTLIVTQTADVGVRFLCVYVTAPPSAPSMAMEDQNCLFVISSWFSVWFTNFMNALSILMALPHLLTIFPHTYLHILFNISLCTSSSSCKVKGLSLEVCPCQDCFSLLCVAISLWAWSSPHLYKSYNM